MKDAHDPQTAEVSAPDQGAAIVAFSKLPPHHNAACAEVLLRLLSGQVMNGMGGVFDVSSTRLAAHINYLEKVYRWHIERGDKVVGCHDGRTVHVAEYSLSPDTITQAMREGAADWCKAVRVARLALRTQAAKAKAAAVKANTAAAMRRRAVAAKGQADLFGSAS